jgi:hypothetical protein
VKHPRLGSESGQTLGRRELLPWVEGGWSGDEERPSRMGRERATGVDSSQASLAGSFCGPRGIHIDARR